MDDKGRMSLPAPFRRLVGDQTVVVVQVHSNALTVYPEPAWNAVEVRMLEMMRKDPASREFVLRITSRASVAPPDKQGRILLPQRLTEPIGLGQTALVVGLIDRMEVWVPEVFEAMTGERKPEYDRYASEVFS
jgi:MraZ protein